MPAPVVGTAPPPPGAIGPGVPTNPAPVTPNDTSNNAASDKPSDASSNPNVAPDTAQATPPVAGPSKTEPVVRPKSASWKLATGKTGQGDDCALVAATDAGDKVFLRMRDKTYWDIEIRRAAPPEANGTYTLAWQGVYIFHLPLEVRGAGVGATLSPDVDVDLLGAHQFWRASTITVEGPGAVAGAVLIEGVYVPMAKAYMACLLKQSKFPVDKELPASSSFISAFAQQQKK